MKTIYNLFNKTRGIPFSILTALGLFICSNSNAQITGNYTIDRNGTASATVYKDFKSVVDDLKGVTRSDGGASNNTGTGVTGNAVFTVLAGSGPYTWTSTDQLVIPVIATTSSTKTVTFKGNNEIINYTGSSSDRAAIRLDGADWFRFDSIQLYNLRSTQAWGFQFRTSADNNIIENCVVRCPNVTSGTTSTGSVSACIVFSDNNTTINSSQWGTNSLGSNGSKNIIRKNSIGGKDDGNSAGSGPAYGVIIMGDAGGSGADANVVENNRITNIYWNSVESTNADATLINKNNISSPESNDKYRWGANGIYVDNWNGPTSNSVNVTNNKIFNNYGTNLNSSSTYYGIYIYDGGNVDLNCNNNSITDLQATSSLYGIYSGGYNSFTSKMYHNTFSYDHPTQSNSPTVYGVYISPQGSAGADFRNNNITITQPGGSSTRTRYGIFDRNWGSATLNYNNVFVDRSGTGTPTTGDLYGYQGSAKSTLTDWQASGNGPQSTDLQTAYVDWANGDLRPLSFELNNTGTNLGFTKDINDSNRNVATPDKGAFEIKIDASVTAFPWTGLNVCGNYTEQVTVTIRNNNSFDIKNVPVSWQINNNTPVTEIITDTIAVGASVVYTFNAIPKFNTPGANTIKAGVGAADDDAANNLITVNLNVTKTPEGSILSQKAGAKGIYNPGNAFDITVPNEPLVYQFTPPTDLTNAQYGTAITDKWNGKAEVRSFTSGALITPAPIVTAPGAGDMEVSFDPPFAMTDSMLVLSVIFTDPSTGCDTTINKSIFVAPRCVPAFEFPTTVCEGDNVLFDNFSTVSSKFTTNKWEFGTGNIADTANSTNPVFTFPGNGTYDVTLRCKTNPYGYVDTLVKTVTVTPIPVVAFTRTNACEGDAVQLVNNTVPANASFKWTLGDGSPTVITTNVNKVYANPGGYAVTLEAEKNGCAASITKNVYQFARPIANASLISGTCDNQKFKFGNTTSISIGASGFLWNFDEPNAISTDKEPEYKFTSPGLKKVRLTAVSEFGCTDTLSTPLLVTVKAAPTAMFTNTQPCSQTPTVFTNTSVTPSGTPTNTWTIEGVTDINNLATRSHNWSSLGKQIVVLQVASDNGCTDVFTKELNVLIQPVADFSVADICQGEPAIFTNLTTWPEGQIAYSWDFGDGATSMDGAPIHAYDNSVVGQRNVVLNAQILGGCASTKSIAVEVKEKPSTCDFEFKNNYNFGTTAFDLNPIGGIGSSTANTNYKWVYSFGGTDQTVATGKTGKVLPSALHTVEVTMIASKNGCECSVTKGLSQQVINQTVGINQLPNGGEFKIYPNPSNGNVNIEVANNNQNLVVEVYNAVGAKVATVNTNNANNGVFNVNLTEQAAGLYLVKVTTGNETISQRITLTK